MVHMKRALAVALTAGAMTVSGLGATATAQTPSAGRSAAAAITCVGSSFSGTLGVNQAICNSGYQVMMQDNGDLVLRTHSGSPCWASGSRAPGDASATFVGTVFGAPYIDINSTSQGRVGRVLGAHTATTFGTNASVNNKGEFWVGYKKVGWC
ncbi:MULTISPECIES: hypothetical protein [unclassified Streptomyces]|uniref:hypothetical protein n=1 Tax=unclassified Streptomyces TaxID=2593676 RepID=UPI002E290DEF|nr:hypothetical protein [Streptomyces sp. NBC_01429]